MERRLLTIINTVLSNGNRAQLDQLDKTLDLRDDLHFDSLILAELTVRIEEEFGVDIFEDGLVRTVDEIVQKLDASVPRH